MLVDTHHRMFWFYHGEKKTQIRTRISQGSKTLDDYLMAQMGKQMKLTRKEFDSFIECNMSGEMYSEKMLRDGHVNP